MDNAIKNIIANIEKKLSFNRVHIEAILAAIKKYNPNYTNRQIRATVQDVLVKYANTPKKKAVLENILNSLPKYKNYPK